MNKKTFSKFELARFKRTAQNVDQYIQKKNKLSAKIAELQAELDSVQTSIDLEDAATKHATGGYGTEDIIRKRVIPTDKVDKNGNVIKNTVYEFIYPETIIPPVQEDNTPGETNEMAAGTAGVETATETATETDGGTVPSNFGL